MTPSHLGRPVAQRLHEAGRDGIVFASRAVRVRAGARLLVLARHVLSAERVGLLRTCLAVALTGCLGGPVQQSPACAAWVACIHGQDAASGRTTNLDRFEPGGACWTSGEIAELCTTGCERGLEWIRGRLGECAP